MTTTRLLSVGEVARETGMSVSALRYYDDLGLISNTARVGGKRRFEPNIIGRVSFIRRAKEAGFTLEEIGAILDDRAGSWPALVDKKLIELSARRDRLNLMIEMIREIRECGCEAVASCPSFPAA